MSQVMHELWFDMKRGSTCRPGLKVTSVHAISLAHVISHAQNSLRLFSLTTSVESEAIIFSPSRVILLFTPGYAKYVKGLLFHGARKEFPGLVHLSSFQ